VCQTAAGDVSARSSSCRNRGATWSYRIARVLPYQQHRSGHAASVDDREWRDRCAYAPVPCLHWFEFSSSLLSRVVFGRRKPDALSYRPRGRTRKPTLLIGARPCACCERSDWSGHARGHPRGWQTGTFCPSGPGADQARGGRRQALSILPLPTCGLCRPLRWRLLRYGPWCVATILRWVVGTGGLLVDAVVSEA
jgi:hypothetical protein